MRNPFLIERDRYLQIAGDRATDYRTAEPFPHIVFDDFLPPELGRQMIGEYRSPDDPRWKRFNDPLSIKLATNGAEDLEPLAQTVLQMFCSAPFLEFLERLTGIEGLIPDPWFEGGGLHQIPRGGFLKIHADFNRHRKLRLDRRINVLWYLNEDWLDEYGGRLELWDREMKHPVQKILPLFNRCVIFNTTDWAYHGHPDVLTCPEGRTRKSVALYYYTNGRPEEERSEDHSTLFQVRPEEQERMRSWKYRLQLGSSNALEQMASLAHKPAGLLRWISQKIRPRH